MNARFSEYVTSGAFNMTLTRAQISALGMLGSGDASCFAASLERKGLAAPIASPIADDRVQWRITGAGAICLSLLHEAGLTNAGKDAAATEIDNLRQALDEANRTVRDVRKKTWSMYAKLQEAEAATATLKRELAAARLEIDHGVKLKPEFAGHRSSDDFHIMARDPLPDLPAADLLDDEIPNPGETP